MAQQANGSPRWFALRTLDGDTIEAGEFRLTPQSVALTLRLPFAAFVWHHPRAVLVERAGHTTRLPIRDATRLAQLGLIGGCVLIALVGRMVANTKKEERSWVSY